MVASNMDFIEILCVVEYVESFFYNWICDKKRKPQEWDLQVLKNNRPKSSLSCQGRWCTYVTLAI